MQQRLTSSYSLLHCTVLGLLLLSSKPANAQDPVPSTAPSTQPAVRVIGPLAVKDLMEAVVQQYDKAVTPTALHFQRADGRAWAASQIVSGRELALVFGEITLKDIGDEKRRWNATPPQEYVLGARSVALVVHPSNPLESLTTDQIAGLYSGKIADWKLLGAAPQTIRRYGLGAKDPLTLLFHERTIASGKSAPYTRKKDSDELAAAVAQDPQGIGFMDVVTATTQGGQLRIVPIFDGKKAIWPNAQTIRDRSYALSHPLMLYVSPRASERAKGLASYLVSGHADALLRQHGFLPAVQPAIDQAAALFERVYGDDIKRVKATPEPDDDIALAKQILSAARSTKLDESMVRVMCKAAFDLANSSLAGQTTALEAAQTLWQKVPEGRFLAAECRAKLYQREYELTERRVEAEHYINALIDAAEAGTAAGAFAPAEVLWRRAIEVAERTKARQCALLKQRLPAFAARAAAVKEVNGWVTTAETQSLSDQTRQKLLWSYLLEMDDPVRAAKYLDAASEETLKSNLPLAQMKLSEVAEDTAFRLAEWYSALVSKAGVGGQELMARRSRGYYLRFFELHRDRTDNIALRAELGLKKVGGQVPPVPVPGKAPPRVDPELRVLFQPEFSQDIAITNTRLAEIVIASPELATLGRKELGSPELLTDLRPLWHLPKLRSVDLSGAVFLKDLTPFTRLLTIESLILREIAATDLEALASLSRLEQLDLSGAANVQDISPLAHLSRLRGLSLAGCTKVTSVDALSGLRGLTSLNLAGTGISDLKPIEKLEHVTHLNLGGCENLRSILGLLKSVKLKQLDLRGCPQVSSSDVEALQSELTKCRILFGQKKR